VLKIVSFSEHILRYALQTFCYELPIGKRAVFFSQQVSNTVSCPECRETITGLFSEDIML
jgi:hypothetical protein